MENIGGGTGSMTKAFRECGLKKGFTPPPAVTSPPNGAEPWRLCNITIGICLP